MNILPIKSNLGTPESILTRSKSTTCLILAAQIPSGSALYSNIKTSRRVLFLCIVTVKCSHQKTRVRLRKVCLKMSVAYQKKFVQNKIFIVQTDKLNEQQFSNCFGIIVVT